MAFKSKHRILSIETKKWNKEKWERKIQTFNSNCSPFCSIFQSKFKNAHFKKYRNIFITFLLFLECKHLKWKLMFANGRIRIVYASSPLFSQDSCLFVFLFSCSKLTALNMNDYSSVLSMHICILRNPVTKKQWM